MSKVGFRSKEFGKGNNDIIALVSSFGSKISDYEATAQNLSNLGNDVVLYQYSPDVFLEGDPFLLPELINDLSQDFLQKSTNHLFRRYSGVSLGAGLALNMQKQSENLQDERTLTGLYGTMGSNTSKIIMENRYFQAQVIADYKLSIKKQFEKNGYMNTEDLHKVWGQLHVPPVIGFSVVLHPDDRIVNYKEATHTLHSWMNTNRSIKIHDLEPEHHKYRQVTSHAHAVEWFKKNTELMLRMADEL